MNPNNLKYGDYIVISSADTHTNQFLAARSLHDPSVKVVYENSKTDPRLQSLDLSLYPNLSELVFQMRPPSQYQLSQRLRNTPINDPRRALIKRRSEAEETVNQQTESKLAGKTIKSGDPIQLYHEFTSSLVSFSSQRKGYVNIFGVKLSPFSSAETHLRIRSKQTLKKDGDLITLDEKLTLICEENYNSIGFLESNRTSIPLNKNPKKKKNFGEKKCKNSRKEIDLDLLPQITNHLISERQGLFTVAQAFCTNLNGIRGTEDLKYPPIFSYAIKLFKVAYTPQKKRHLVKYGDFVRVRQSENLKDPGFLVSEDNYTGFSPEVLCRRYPDPLLYSCQLHFSSIFQVVPRRAEDYGSLIQLNEANHSEIHLRHYLTGRMLHIDSSEDTSLIQESGTTTTTTTMPKRGKDYFRRPHLSQDFVSFAKSWLDDPANQEAIQKKLKASKATTTTNKNQLQSTQFNNEDYFFQKYNQAYLESNLAPENTTIETKRLNQMMTRACITAYFDRYSIHISKDESDKQSYLSVKDIVCLSSNRHYSIKVNSQVTLNSNPIYDKKSVYYQPCFHRLSVGVFTTHFIEIVPPSRGAGWQFEHVNFQDIQKGALFSSLLSPLLGILSSKSYDEEDASSCIDAVNSLKHLLFNSEADSGNDTVLYSDIQDAYRDLSVLDVAILFFYYYLHFGLKGDLQFEEILNSLASLFKSCCRDNKLNAYYLYQWHQLFIGFILNNVWSRPELSMAKCEVNADSVIEAILQKQEFNSIIAKESLQTILNNINFEDYSLKKLKLLTALLASSKERDKNLLILIEAQILQSNSYNSIFKPFFEYDGVFFMRVDYDLEIDLCKLSRRARKEMIEEEENMITVYSSKVNDKYNDENYQEENLMSECDEDEDDRPSSFNSLDYDLTKNKGKVSRVRDNLAKQQQDDYEHSQQFQNQSQRQQQGPGNLAKLIYIEQTVLLAIELCKGYANLFEPRYRQFLPPLLCVKMIQCKKLSTYLRAYVMTLFRVTYLEVKCQEFRKTAVPDFLRFMSVQDQEEVQGLQTSVKMEILVGMYLLNTSGYALIPYMISFLRNPENFEELDLKLPILNSTINLLTFLIERDFLELQVISLINLSLFQYLKNLISYEMGRRETEELKILSQSSTLLKSFSTNFNNHNNTTPEISSRMSYSSLQNETHDPKASKSRQSLLLDIEEYFNTDQLTFIHRILQCILKIEELKVNEQLEDTMEVYSQSSLFDNRRLKASDFLEKIDKFEIRQYFQKMEPEAELVGLEGTPQYLAILESKTFQIMSEFLDKKISEKRRELDQIGLQLIRPNRHLSYLLIDLICTKDLKIAETSINIITKNCIFRSNFLKTLPFLQLIQKDGVMDRLHRNFDKVFKVILSQSNRLKKLNLQRAIYDDIVASLDILNQSLGDLMADLVVLQEKGDGDKLKARQLYVDGLLKTHNLRDLDTCPRPGYFVNMFNLFFLDLDHYDLKQILFKNMGFIDCILELIEIVPSLEVAVRSEEDFSPLYFSGNDAILQDPGEGLCPQSLMVREILLKCVVVLTYCSFLSPQNQVYIRDRICERSSWNSLFMVFLQDKSTAFSRPFLNFMMVLYGTNLHFLLKVPSLHYSEPILKIVEALASQIGVSRINLLTFHLLTSLRAFISYKGMPILNNREYILGLFLGMPGQVKDNLRHFLGEVLPIVVLENTVGDSCFEEGFPALLELGAEQEKVTFIDIPIQIAFAVQFLRFLTEICGDDIPPQKRYQLQDLIPLKILIGILNIKEMDWHSLRREVYLYITQIFLQGDLDLTDEQVFHLEVLPIACRQLASLQERLEARLSDQAKVFYITDIEQYPGNYVVSGTNSNYKQLVDSLETTLIKSTLQEGVLPLLQGVLANLEQSSSKQTAQLLYRMFQDLLVETRFNDKDKNIRKAGRKLRTLYYKNNSSFKNKSLDVSGLYNKEEDEGGNFEIQYTDFLKEGTKKNTTSTSKMSGRNCKLIYDIKNLLSSKKSHLKSLTRDNTIDNTFFSFSNVNTRLVLCEVSYYRYSLSFPDRTAPLGAAAFDESHFYDLYSDFMEEDYYKNMEDQDYERLMVMLLGIRLDSPKKFNLILEVFLELISYQFNDKEAKSNALHLLAKLLESSRSKRVDIIGDLLEMGIVEILCKLVISNSKDSSFCGLIIQMLTLVLQEVDTSIQETLYSFLCKEDEDNNFILTVLDYLEGSFHNFCSSEILRMEIASKLQGGEDSQQDQVAVQQESDLHLERIICCLEMLRLMCENHFQKLQDFLRKQVDSSGREKVSSVNMLVQVGDMLAEFKDLVEESNVPFIEKVYELLTELLQGPCIENQRMVASSKIMETTEDLIITLSKLSSLEMEGGIGSKGRKAQIMRRQYSVSSLIQKMIAFMSAIIEANQEHEIVSNVAVHVQLDTVLDRLETVYSIFNRDIRSSKLGALNMVKGYTNTIKRTTATLKNQTTNMTSKINESLSKEDREEQEGSEILPFEVLVSKEEASGLHLQEYNPIIMEGIKIWVFLASLSEVSTSFKNTMFTTINSRSSENYISGKVYAFFQDKVASIELVNMLGGLQKVFFPIHPLTLFLSDFRKIKFEKDVDRTLPEVKLQALVDNFPEFYREMQHLQSLSVQGIKVNINYFAIIKWTSLSLVILANIIELVNHPAPRHSIGFSLGDSIIRGILFLIMTAYIAIFILWIVFNAKLDLQKIWIAMSDRYFLDSLENNPVIRAYRRFLFFWDFLTSFLVASYLLDLLTNFLFILLALTVSRIFIAFLLIDVIFRFVLLSNVVRAIALNTKQLFMTGLLGLAILNIYSSITYFTIIKNGFIFLEKPDYKIVDSFIQCFWFIVGFGLRSGGGIGDVLRYPSYETEFDEYLLAFFLDFSFFVIMILIFFNIVSGFIIDTFGDLREQKTRDDFDKEMVCYICGLERTLFVKNGVDFEDHRTQEHGKWSYISFLAHLHEIDENDLDGVESYVFEKVRKEGNRKPDISWIPMGVATSLQSSGIGTRASRSMEDIFGGFWERLKKKAYKVLGERAGDDEILDFIGNLEV